MPGEYHMVVHVCIFNSTGEMLIQQRQPFKEGFPNMWDITVGGSALAGDTSQSAAEREVFEELGYQVNLQHRRPSLTINFPTGFDDIYLVEENLDISSLRLQYEEVQKVAWADCNHIIQLIERSEFIPYHKSFIALLFDMRKMMGAFLRS